jgi:hypothetical protein
MIEGVEKDIAKPAFDWFAVHKDVIEGDLKEVADYMSNNIPKAIDATADALKGLKPIADELRDVIVEMTTKTPPGTRFGDDLKQAARDKFGSFPTDVFLDATNSEDIPTERFIGDLFDNNEDGSYQGHPAQPDAQTRHLIDALGPLIKARAAASAGNSSASQTTLNFNMNFNGGASSAAIGNAVANAHRQAIAVQNVKDQVGKTN